MSIEHFITSGGIVAVIIAVMAVEALVLLVFFRRIPAMLMGVAAGACLALALGAALQQRGWISIAICLGMALAFHLLELWQWLLTARRMPR